MSLLAAGPGKSSSWPITVGGAGIAAAQFARCGFDVLAQTGPDKPWYDLVVTKGGNLLKVSVKASEDGRWCLAQSYLGRAGDLSGKSIVSRGVIDRWLDIHGSRTLYCLVQFEGVSLNQLPRIYLATPPEIAHRMREIEEHLGDSILYEQYEWTNPETGYTAVEALPSEWLFSHERVHDLLAADASHPVSRPIARKSVSTETWSEPATARHSPLREAILTA